MSKQDSTINIAVTAPSSLGEALFGFYRHSMYVFRRPSPASFAERRYGWDDDRNGLQYH